MKKITASGVRSKDIDHSIALILDAASVMNMFTLSSIVHTRYLLLEPQQLITNLPDIAMLDQVQDTTVKTETGKANPDHNLIFEYIIAWVIMIHRGHWRSQHWD